MCFGINHNTIADMNDIVNPKVTIQAHQRVQCCINIKVVLHSYIFVLPKYLLYCTRLTLIIAL